MEREATAEQIAVESRRVERVYAQLARVYDESIGWSLDPGRRRAVVRLDAHPGDRVLEVGVGTGLSLPLYPDGVRVTGIDISPAMLERAHTRMDRLAKQGVELRRMDARSLDFPDATFDAVFAPYVISVVPDPGRVMSEIRRVCRPGGTVVVVNRFRTRYAWLRPLERLFTPLTCWVGFRLDLPIETVTSTPGLDLVRVERVNLMRLWHLVTLKRS